MHYKQNFCVKIDVKLHMIFMISVVQYKSENESQFVGNNTLSLFARK